MENGEGEWNQFRYEQMVQAYYSGYDPASTKGIKEDNPFYDDLELYQEFERGTKDGLSQYEGNRLFGQYE